MRKLPHALSAVWEKVPSVHPDIEVNVRAEQPLVRPVQVAGVQYLHLPLPTTSTPNNRKVTDNRKTPVISMIYVRDASTMFFDFSSIFDAERLLKIVRVWGPIWFHFSSQNR